MIRRLAGGAVLAAGLLAASCTSPSYPVAGPASPPAAPAAPPQLEARLATPAPRAVEAPKACSAAEFQSLIGHPRTEVPVPLDPGRQRVACTTCPAADNADPNRLNFLFDAQTGLIKEVRCG